MAQIDLSTLPRSRKEAKALGLTQYFTGKPCKHGHIDARNTCDGTCRECARAKYRKWAEKNDRSEWNAEYKQKNRKRLSANKKKWYHANGGNPGVVSRRRDPKHHKLMRAAWRKRNRASIQAYESDYLATNIEARLARYLRNRVKSALRADKRGPYKTNSTTVLIGCSWAQLRAHLAAQFQPDMNWDNYGEWHIDHIRPCASFDLTDPEQQKECFHYSNLQPLWAEDNLRKSAKWAA